MVSEWLPVLKEMAQEPGLLKEIYGDLAKPGVAQVGKAFGTILGLGNTILWPFALLNERAKVALEKNLEKYRAQLEQVPEDNIAALPPEIGVPIAEKLSYVTDEQLSDLYVNLLAKASTVNFANVAHPSFVNVINYLSPDEALLLQHLNGDLPFVEARHETKGSNEFRILGKLLTGLEFKTKLSFPQNMVAYFSNFEGLGIINVRRDMTIAIPKLYEDLEQKYRPLYENVQNDKDSSELKFERGLIELTPFGGLFVAACLTKLRWN
jgi:hypothetical protein